jgi:hypothetical protein
MKAHKYTLLSVLSLILAGTALKAAPVPVTVILTAPGFSSIGTTSNGQTLAYTRLRSRACCPPRRRSRPVLS